MRKIILALMCYSATVCAADSPDKYNEWWNMQIKGHDYIYMQKKGSDNGSFIHDPDCKRCLNEKRVIVINNPTKEDQTK